MCKTSMLGICYGMGRVTLSKRTGLDDHQCASLLAKIRRTFPTMCEWSDAAVGGADMRGYASTVLGWPLLTNNKNLRMTTLKNFPVQANAAEMLRLACCLATERGVQVCAPIHDALLIEADSDQIGEALTVTQAAMAEASGIVLRGLVIDTDVSRTTWPNRYIDSKDRGQVMWEKVTKILDGLDGLDGINDLDGLDGVDDPYGP